MNYKTKSFMKKKAFTLIELLVVIAIIGILFIVLVSKVDFATDKAKATGVQTDFRSFQLAFQTVAREHQGFSSLVDEDYERLEMAINKNLDNKLKIDIDDDGMITMANGATDPWNVEYHGQYVTGEDGKDRGAIVMYSNGSDLTFGSSISLTGGITSINTTDDAGKDDYAIVSCYSLVNGGGSINNLTIGFGNNVSDNINADNLLNNNLPAENPNGDLITYVESDGWVALQNLARAKLSVEDYRDKYGIEVGDTLEVDGQTYVLVDLGLDEGDYDGFVFMFFDGKISKMSTSGYNTGGYRESLAAQYFNDLYNDMEGTELYTVIKEVDVLCGNGTNKEEPLYSEKYHIFLPSQYEVGFADTMDKEPVDGREFDYFYSHAQNGTFTTNYVGGYWWTRTSTPYSTSFYITSTIYGSNYASNCSMDWRLVGCFVVG